jgi:hypothetical protein
MRFRLLIAVLLACSLAASWGCSSQRSTEPVTKTGNPFDRIKKPVQ